MKLKVKLRNNGLNDIKSKDTVLVPRFRSNLLSVSRIIDNDYTVTFKKRHAFMYRNNDSTALVVKRKGNLYIVDEAEQPRALTVHDGNDNLLHWHQRFGHLNFGDLKKLRS